jgi:hypothetical protein
MEFGAPYLHKIIDYIIIAVMLGLNCHIVFDEVLQVLMRRKPVVRYSIFFLVELELAGKIGVPVKPNKLVLLY